MPNIHQRKPYGDFETLFGKKLEEKGVQKVFLTLHVGAGTFLPVKTDDTKDHKMHAEYGITF